MFSLKPDKDIHVEKIKIITKQRNIPALILRPKYTRQSDSAQHGTNTAQPDTTLAKQAVEKFNEHFEYALKHYFA